MKKKHGKLLYTHDDTNIKKNRLKIVCSFYLNGKNVNPQRIGYA